MQDVMEAPFFKEEAPSPGTMKRKRHSPHVGDAKRVKAGVKPEGREVALGAMVNNTTAKGAMAALRPRSVALTGRRVTVYWSGDRKWFNGCVGALQPDGQHMVHYDDGENKEEELDNDGVEWELLLTAGAGTTPGTPTKVEDRQRDFYAAVVEASIVQAETCNQRFVQGPQLDVSGRKSHFFRELDRHTMYYVRARRAMLARMRGMPSGTLRPGYDLGELSQAEAQAVVMATVIFRLFNRMDTFVRFHVMSRHVKDPRTATLAAWKAALGKLTVTDVAEIKRAERKLVPSVAPGAAIAVAVAPEYVHGFLNFIDAVFDAKGVAPGDAKTIKVFTGQHQVQGRVNSRRGVEQVLADLDQLTADLRKASGAKACCERLKGYRCFGPFVQYQVYLDLIEPHHSIFRGQPNEARIEADRFEYAQFGPGSRGGAMLVSTGKRKDCSQKEALEVAKSLLGFASACCGPKGEVGGGSSWHERWQRATASLCPLPDGVRGHLGGCGVGWDLQSIENKLCGIHNTKTPEAILAKAGALKECDHPKYWVPNPCTQLEYEELYRQEA